MLLGFSGEKWESRAERLSFHSKGTGELLEGEEFPGSFGN